MLTSTTESCAALLWLALALAVCAGGSQGASLQDQLEKRAPFSSWAGKREVSSFQQHRPDLAQLLHDLQELYTIEGEEQAAGRIFSPVKRAPFSSWAGKKRAPFSSWAGKRAPFSSWAGKRAPFSSWAGKKRSSSEELWDDEPDEGMELASGHRIKRSSAEDEAVGDGGDDDDSLIHARRRRGANSFSAWGGKRFARNVQNSEIMPVRVMRPQRAAFSAWGG